MYPIDRQANVGESDDKVDASIPRKLLPRHMSSISIKMMIGKVLLSSRLVISTTCSSSVCGRVIYFKELRQVCFMVQCVRNPVYRLAVREM